MRSAIWRWLMLVGLSGLLARGVLASAPSCAGAISELEEFLAQQPLACQGDADCDGFYFRADACKTAVVLPKKIVDGNFMLELQQRQARARVACTPEWQARPVCEPEPYRAACKDAKCVDLAH